MTIEELIARLPLITGTAFGFGALLVLVAMRFFRRSRRAPYWTQRRQAGQRGFRVLLFSMFFFTISALLCILTLANNYIESDEPTSVAQNTTETPADITLSVTAEKQSSATLTLEPPAVSETVEVELTSTITEEPTVEDTSTPTGDATAPATDTTELPQPSEISTDIPPTATRLTLTSTDVLPTETNVPPTATEVPPTATDTAMPTVTNTATTVPTLTATSSPTATSQPTSAVVIATVVGSQTPSADASLSIISLSNRISNDLKPTNEGTEFDAGFRRLYFMLDYDNMDSGVRWRRELYHNGILVGGREDLWGNQSTGQALFFVSLADGFGAGEYEIRVYIEADLLDEMDFTVN